MSWKECKRLSFYLQDKFWVCSFGYGKMILYFQREIDELIPIILFLVSYTFHRTPDLFTVRLKEFQTFTVKISQDFFAYACKTKMKI